MDVQFFKYSGKDKAIFICDAKMPIDAIMEQLARYGEVLSVARYGTPNGEPTQNILVAFKKEVFCRSKLKLTYLYSRRGPKQKDRIFFNTLPHDTDESLMHEFSRFGVLDYVHLANTTAFRPGQI